MLPFNTLIKRERLKAIKEEHDRELTHAPALSKRSKTIAERKLLEQSLEIGSEDDKLYQ